ncbi:uncharacterized protein LOC125874820 isoform X2 [Solanum stenotomum]|uniref:uncharacterized protein LOC125874820 isoform X2 n=1 Tax=Solanum stenotomum TaxID=172797 RepID=UPI0020D0B60B|nr:uncharacterized protein LOC125874820 isoform X2 [Solanum stenotomum]
MDQKLPVMAKNFWKIVRVAYFMLRKGLSSKRKLMFDLNLLMKRGKIAGKAAFQNLMFQGHNNNNIHQSISKEYYEFSCSNSPAFHLPFNMNKRISKHSQPEHGIEYDDVSIMNAAVLKALEMLQSETESPALPGFGRTPTVRQLRITDSPFPLREADDNGDMISHVDEKADEFISRFYRDLRREASAFA